MSRALPKRLQIVVIILVAVILTLYPVVWMLSASFKSSSEIFTTSAFLVGSQGFANYLSAFLQRPFFLYLLNSLFAALMSVALTIFLGGLAGYAFAKFRFRFATGIWALVLASLMIPLEAIVIPLFLEVHAFGWTNTYAGLILPTAFNVVGVFIFRQAMLTVPDDFIEAGRIDGASELRILWSIVVPMILPTVVVVAVLTFNLSWNSYLWPLVVTSSDSLRTLPLGMAAFQANFDTKYGEVMAVSVFGTLPTILFFMFLQRYFVESATAAGLK